MMHPSLAGLCLLWKSPFEKFHFSLVLNPDHQLCGHGMNDYSSNKYLFTQSIRYGQDVMQYKFLGRIHWPNG